METTCLQIKKRTGKIVEFDPQRIFNAINKAFLSLNLSDENTVKEITEEVISIVSHSIETNAISSVEEVQDIVEETLMKRGHHRVAKSYILYRNEQKKKREEQVLSKIKTHQLEVVVNDNETVIFDAKIIEERLRRLTPDLIKVSITEMIESITKQIYDKIPQKEIELLVLGAARERIEVHYEYSYLASRVALNDLYKRVLNDYLNSDTISESYKNGFAGYIQKGIDYKLLSPELGTFDLEKLGQAIDANKDKKFFYLGIQIIMDRYLQRERSSEKQIIELPQWFWMRVAMGLSTKETNREEAAIEFYNTLSSLDLVSSTPTLFNSGTLHSQMSSCYLNVAEDSLDSIFKLFSDNAQLSKWAGGIGSDWSYIRATGSPIHGTNGLSQGVIPFIKIFNDVALAVNQGGKRKGAMCAYMEVWHLDFEQFVELKKNTGDERRRAHDINTAAWIPDLFMKRVREGGKWTLFCPSDTPELHDLYGKEFEEKYNEYEQAGLPRAKTVQALDLWKKMLTMLYETGHPWITFKDACNVRNPQDHTGVVHSSNLCTEITLNTSKDETAVCNLASLNLSHMLTPSGELDEEKIAKTVRIGIRMLDNVIDNNYYPTVEAKRANLRHRAIGLGLMGYQDAVFKKKINFDSVENLDFADESMEMVSYYALLASSELAKERGTYETFKGSKWDRGILPIDTLTILENERQIPIKTDRKTRLDWDGLRKHIQDHGMRNSNTMAIAPTATISNISGSFPCTEPAFKNIYMKENLSGNFIVINRYLVDTLEKLNLWTPNMLQRIKMNNGSIQTITDIPESIRARFKETFEIDMKWIVDAAALRGKWIDQSASTNIFMKTKSGKDLSDIYIRAWETGLKTTYYLRTLGASQVTKATINDVEISDKTPAISESEGPKVCSILDPDCEACQ